MGSPYEFTTQKAIEAVRNTVGDPDSGRATRWSDSEVQAYLNRAQLVVARDADILVETIWELTLADGTRDYELPAGMIRDKTVEIEYATDDRRKLRYLTTDDWNSSYSRNPTVEGVPEYYHLWRSLGGEESRAVESRIYLYPTPDDTVDAKTLRIFGYKVPDELDIDAGDHVLEIEPQYVEAMISMAGLFMHQDDGNLQAAGLSQAIYDRQLVAIISGKARKSRSGRPRLKPRSSAFSTSRSPAWKPWRIG